MKHFRRPRVSPRYTDDDIRDALRAAAKTVDKLTGHAYQAWRLAQPDPTKYPSIAHLGDVQAEKNYSWKMLLTDAGVPSEGIRENTAPRADYTTEEETLNYLEQFATWARDHGRGWRVRDYEDWRREVNPDAPTRKTALKSLRLKSWFDVWDILEQTHPRVKRGTVVAPFTKWQREAFAAHQKGPNPGICTNCRSAPWTVRKDGLHCKNCGEHQGWAWEAWLRTPVPADR